MSLDAKVEMVSALEGKKTFIGNLLDGNGWVRVIDVGPNLVPAGRGPEYLIAKAARASYDTSNKSAKADKGLIEFLVRNNHTSPLEMCNITFCMKLPIAICRQLLRHRTGKFNEFSQRYTEVTDEVDRFRLDGYGSLMRGPSAVNHQASGFNLSEEQVSKIQDIVTKQEQLQEEVFKGYKELIDAGLAKELARFYLPVSTYTKIFVQFDLNNLMKFLRLRTAPDAQYEIRVFAEAMEELSAQFFPAALGIYKQYKGGCWLGEYEMQMIKTGKIPVEVTSKTHRVYLKELAKDLGIKLTE
tara:strand:- start:130 stop:1026 length:897 start_codon:yes stop_codon:yes gene_type:complete